MLARAPPLQGPLDQDGSPASGLRDLDDARALRPGELTLVDVGGSSDVLYAWMADVAVRGKIALVADGSNFLDVYRLATAARRRAAARFPDATRAELAAAEEAVLDRVRVARGFTAHQIQAIVEDLLPDEGKREGKRKRKGEREGEGGGEGEGEREREREGVGLLVAPGLLEMYLDDELSREESKAMATRALATLRRMARKLRVPAVVSNTTLSPTSDHPIRVLLEESIDEHVILRAAPGGAMAVALPRRGALYLAPAEGVTRLEDYLAHEERAVRIAPIPRRSPGEWRSNGNRMYGKFGEVHRRADHAVHEAREAA